jgi:hypothetical protein
MGGGGGGRCVHAIAVNFLSVIPLCQNIFQTDTCAVLDLELKIMVL